MHECALNIYKYIFTTTTQARRFFFSSFGKKKKNENRKQQKKKNPINNQKNLSTIWTFAKLGISVTILQELLYTHNTHKVKKKSAMMKGEKKKTNFNSFISLSQHKDKKKPLSSGETLNTFPFAVQILRLHCADCLRKSPFFLLMVMIVNQRVVIRFTTPHS